MIASQRVAPLGAAARLFAHADPAKPIHIEDVACGDSECFILFIFVLTALERPACYLLAGTARSGFTGSSGTIMDSTQAAAQR
jgi:hypothetical protein